MGGPRLHIFSGEAASGKGSMRRDTGNYPEWFLQDPDAMLQFRGIRLRLLYRGDEPGDFSLLAVDLAPHAVILRHRHDTDCLYVVSEGSITLGSRTIEAGGGFFVGAGQPYGYQAGPDGAVVLETRSDVGYDTTALETDPERQRAIVENARAHLDEWDAYFATKPGGPSEYFAMAGAG